MRDLNFGGKTFLSASLSHASCLLNWPKVESCLAESTVEYFLQRDQQTDIPVWTVSQEVCWPSSVEPVRQNHGPKLLLRALVYIYLSEIQAKLCDITGTNVLFVGHLHTSMHTYTNTHTRKHAHIHKHTHTQTCTHTQTHTQACTHTQTCTRTQTHTHKHAHIPYMSDL